MCTNTKKTHIILRLWLMVLAIAFVLPLGAQSGADHTDGTQGYNIVDLEVVPLPDLNTARSGHSTFYLNGELTVLGGHTDGFVLTPTIEYFRDSAWHTVPMVYPHDAGAVLKLRSGKVLLAGGHKEDLGIEQLFSAELYDPTTHLSQGFGCMDRKRAYANAAEMADGQVVIAGNWFNDDGLEVFENVYDAKLTNAANLKDVSVARATPYILRISDDDAIVFGTLDERAEHTDYGIVDRLKGSSYREPFLETWHPIHTIAVLRSTNQFIGDEARGDYQWLLPVEKDETKRVAIALVKGPTDAGGKPSFALLPTKQPLPDSIRGQRIIYSSLVCDQKRGLAYLIGDDEEARIYVVAINYKSPEATPFTIYVTAPQSILAHHSSPVLTPEGDLVFAGGRHDSNFFPKKTVVRLPVGTGTDSAAVTAVAPPATAEGRFGWLWVAIPCVLACLIAVIAILLWRKRKKAHQTLSTSEAKPVRLEASSGSQDNQLDKALPKDEILADLFKRILRLMNEEQLYLNANLRASDIAARVGSNTAYVSAAINTQRGCSLSQFLNSYRIPYAQDLMRKNPGSKISTISTLSGFSTDSTFFRAFRAATGMSPKEWLSTIKED